MSNTIALWLAFILLIPAMCQVGTRSGSEPSISSISPKQIKMVGETASLECGVQHVSNFMVIWVKMDTSDPTNDQIISSGRSLIIRNSRYNLHYKPSRAIYILELKNLEESDSGTYQCQIVLGITKRITADVELFVASPGAVSQAPENEFWRFCESPTECATGLVCKNGKCDCELDGYSYDGIKKVCLSPIGGPCVVNDDCTSNAYCQRNGLSPGHCHCNETFVVNASGQCEVGFGGRCTRKSDCDSIAGLSCVNGVCKCGGFEEFDTAERKCRGKVGIVCDLRRKNECVPNAQCQQRQKMLPGRCSCSSGYAETGEYTCKSLEELPVTENSVIDESTTTLVDVDIMTNE